MDAFSPEQAHAAVTIPAADVRTRLLTLFHGIGGGSACSWAHHDAAARRHAAAGGSRSACSTVSMPRSQRRGRKVTWKSHKKIALLQTWKSHSFVIFPGRKKPCCFVKIKPTTVSWLVFAFFFLSLMKFPLAKDVRKCLRQEKDIKPSMSAQ